MTRTELVARVRAITLIEDTNVTDATIQAILDEGIREISLAASWPWLEKSATQTLTADQQNYDLPADFDFMVAVVDNDHDTTIPYMSSSNFFLRFGTDDNATTTPDYYTIWEDDILLYPTPSATDNNRLTLYYYKTTPTLTTGGAEPPFHKAFHPILVEYAKWKLFDREEYFDQSERAFITFARYLSQMITWYGRRAQRTPYIAGDGEHRREGDPNIPFLRKV